MVPASDEHLQHVVDPFHRQLPKVREHPGDVSVNGDEDDEDNEEDNQETE